MQTLTGAAQTWLVVNMPATVAGTSETMSARSRFLPLLEPLPVPIRLMSQNTHAARKPCGATIELETCLNLSFIEFHFLPLGGAVRRRFARSAVDVPLGCCWRSAGLLP